MGYTVGCSLPPRPSRAPRGDRFMGLVVTAVTAYNGAARQA